MLSFTLSFLLLGLFILILGIMAYFSWFNYKKIPTFLGKTFPKGLINHQKWSSTRAGEWYLKLFSLFGFLFMVWVIASGINSLTNTQSPVTVPIPTPEVVAKQSKENLIHQPVLGKIVSTGYKIDYESIGTDSNEYTLISDNKKRIKISNESWSKLTNGRIIFEYNIPVHPQNKDILFISTSEASKISEKNINRIFTYNLKTYDLTEIYQEQVDNTLLYSLGTDGSKIIFVRDDENSSPAYCIGLWDPYKSRTHEYLELADVQYGLKEYRVPEYRLVQDEIETEKCLKDAGWLQ